MSLRIDANGCFLDVNGNVTSDNQPDREHWMELIDAAWAKNHPGEDGP